MTVKEPLREYIVCAEVRVGFSAKKPWPVMAMSSVFPLVAMLPCENSCLTDFNNVPDPMVNLEAVEGEFEKMSPNSAVERLKPVVPTFAILLLVAAISACAP